MDDFNDEANESGLWAGDCPTPEAVKLKRDWRREQEVARFYIAKIRAILAKPRQLRQQGRLL